jgi:hypothetical protein
MEIFIFFIIFFFLLAQFVGFIWPAWAPGEILRHIFVGIAVVAVAAFRPSAAVCSGPGRFVESELTGPCGFAPPWAFLFRNGH